MNIFWFLFPLRSTLLLMRLLCIIIECLFIVCHDAWPMLSIMLFKRVMFLSLRLVFFSIRSSIQMLLIDMALSASVYKMEKGRFDLKRWRMKDSASTASNRGFTHALGHCHPCNVNVIRAILLWGESFFAVKIEKLNPNVINNILRLCYSSMIWITFIVM